MLIQRFVPFPAVGKKFVSLSLSPLLFSLFYHIHACLFMLFWIWKWYYCFCFVSLTPCLFFLNVASANVCNVILMRNNELSEGIEVVDKDGNNVGTSVVAAKQVRKNEGKRWEGEKSVRERGRESGEGNEKKRKKEGKVYIICFVYYRLSLILL